MPLFLTSLEEKRSKTLILLKVALMIVLRKWTDMRRKVMEVLEVDSFFTHLGPLRKKLRRRSGSCPEFLSSLLAEDGVHQVLLFLLSPDGGLGFLQSRTSFFAYTRTTLYQCQTA